MSKCCRCIGLKTGLIILAVISLIFSIAVWVVSIPFLAKIEKETFNPLEKYHEQTFEVTEEWIKKYFDFDIEIAHHVNKTLEDTHQDIIVGSTMAFTGVLFLLRQ